MISSIGLSALTALTGCASLGGNIKGSFSCAAPDGICAPSSMIDDRALAMISGDAEEGSTVPAGNRALPVGGRANRGAALSNTRLAGADPARTREKVLRIVFQPYIDERGRLHEASAVHAVVATGEWQQALSEASTTLGGAAFVSAPHLGSLADALDRVDPPGAEVASTHGAPDPAAVAAARARKADPVEAIKADVAARVAPRRSGERQPPTTVDTPEPSSVAVSPALPAPEEVSASGISGADTGPGKTQASISGAGAAAVERVKADPKYQSATSGIAQRARDAAVQSGALPVSPSTTATVTAAGFPGAVAEDK